jgi:hypothetical protein
LSAELWQMCVRLYHTTTATYSQSNTSTNASTNYHYYYGELPTPQGRFFLLWYLGRRQETTDCHTSYFLTSRLC